MCVYLKGFLTEMSVKCPIADELCVVGDQVTKPEKGKDVELKLVVTSKTTAALHLSINLSVQAMRHAGTPATNIQSQAKKHTLQPNSGGSSSGPRLPEGGLKRQVPRGALPSRLPPSPQSCPSQSWSPS